MDTLVFLISKLAALLLRAETWEALLLAAALIALVSGRLRAARRMLSVALASLLALGIFPLGDLLIAPLEQAYPTNPQFTHVDGIIILGGAEDGAGTARHHQVQLNAAERVTAGLALAHRFPDARILLSGGSGDLRDLARESLPGAEVMAAAFRETGIPPTQTLRVSIEELASRAAARIYFNIHKETCNDRNEGPKSWQFRGHDADDRNADDPRRQRRRHAFRRAWR
ncbi:ElyC/SanA/YdcF family protein [Thioclava sp. DLFJ5-1]|uniref:YdcF family protein n=1 Tax=Thioclava sp. DLFJ5-1 TaxID=1915314 RepID=UPI001FEFCF95|nr:ElyC/SanA/YdcF family protein [Thioclava sp. DLFJ5-1]